MWMCIGRQRDILNVYETKLRVLGAVVFVVCISLAWGTVGFTALVVNVRRDVYDFLDVVPYAVFLLVPLAAAVWAYVRMPANLRKEYRPHPVSPDSSQWDLVALTTELSHRLGLKAVPRVLEATRPLLSPVVFGRSRRSSCLLCPEGFRDTLSRRAQMLGIDPENCLKFILLHELSHIRHGDAPFICWAYYYTRAMRKWVGIGLLVGLAYLTIGVSSHFMGNADLSEALSTSLYLWALMGFFAGFQLVFFCLCNSAQRQREIHADARAWLHTQDAATTKTGEGYGGVKKLFTSFGQILPGGTSARTGFVGWATGFAEVGTVELSTRGLPHFIRYLVRRVVSRYPTAEERLKSLENVQSGAEKRFFLSGETAFWSGVNIGLIVTVALAMDLFWIWGIPFGSPSNAMIVAALIIAALAYGGTVLALPVRDNVNPLPVGSLAKGIARALGVVVLGYIVGAACCCFSALPFMPPIFLGVLGAGALYIGNAQLSHHYQQSSEEGWQSAILVAPAFALWLILIAATVRWGRIDFLTILRGVILGMIGTIVVMRAGPFPRYASWRDRWLIVDWQRRPVAWSEGDTFTADSVIWFGGGWSLTLILPWISLTLADMAIERWIDAVGWHPDAYTALVILVAMVAFVAGTRTIRLHRSSVLEEMGLCAAVMRETNAEGEPRLSEHLPAKVKDEGYSSLTPFVDGSLPLPLAEEVFYASSVLDALGGMTVPLKENAAALMLRFECEEGGFGVWEGSSPRLCSTFWALSVLNMCCAVSKVDREKHVKWIATCLQPSYLYRSRWTKRDTLEETFFALNSLSFLRAIDGLDGDRCSGAIIQDWRLGRRDERRTYWCVRALEALGRLESPVREEVRDAWLLPQRVAVQDLRIDTCIGWVSHYVGIVAALEKSGALVASEFISESWYGSVGKALERYLNGLKGKGKRCL